MKGLKKLAVGLMIGFGFASCETDVEKAVTKKKETSEVISDNANLTYFYPRSPKPLVYVYGIENNPFSETYLKITTVTSKGDTLMMLEYFDSELELKEGFTINLDNGFEVTNHMTSSKGIKYTSKISKNKYFPTEDGNIADLIIDFPTQNDTVVGLYERGLELLDTIQYKHQGGSIECLKTVEHIRLTRLHTITKQENEQFGEMMSLYAKGVGKVAQFTANGKDTMKLVRTIPIEEWDKIAPQF